MVRLGVRRFGFPWAQAREWGLRDTQYLRLMLGESGCRVPTPGFGTPGSGPQVLGDGGRFLSLGL